METETFYDILNIENTASPEEIKKAYRSLSLQYHPDRNPEAPSGLYQKINEAYETLSDNSKRKQYDLQLKFSFGSGSIQDELNDINNILNMMFAGGKPPTASGPPPFMNMFGGFGGGEIPMPNIRVFHTNGFPQGPGQNPFMNSHPMEPLEPIIHTIEVNLYEAYHGCIKQIEYERTSQSSFSNTVELMKLDVTIEPGVDDEQVIVFENKGVLNGKSNVGDLHVIVEIAKDSAFEKKGLDLVYKKTLTLKEALCGFSFEITHLSHKVLKINNQNKISIIQPKHQRTISNYGFIKQNKTGNLIIEFSVEFPKSLNDSQIEAIRNIL